MVSRFVCQGDLVLWCMYCNKYHPVPRMEGGWEPDANGIGWDITTCPECDMQLGRERCNRCGYVWNRRYRDRLGCVCPGCKSPYWNRARTKSKVGE